MVQPWWDAEGKVGGIVIFSEGTEHRARGQLRSRRRARTMDRISPPSINPCFCRLGSWLDAEAVAGRGEHPSFRDLDRLHRKFHAHANEIIDRKNQSGETAEPAMLAELRAMRDDLLEKPQHLAQVL